MIKYSNIIEGIINSQKIFNNRYSSAAEYLTYIATVGENQEVVEMRYENENIWLTQKMMATLYDVTTSTINQHIKKIYEDKELEEKATIKKFLIVHFFVLTLSIKLT